MENRKIIMLAGEGDSTNILYHAINDKFPVHKVIMEGKEDRKKFIKRRIKRLGILSVAGQILFQMGIVKILNAVSVNRIQSIVKENNLNISNVPQDKRINVTSVNEARVITLLQEIKPDVIVVNGTRIISKKILNAVDCIFINTHTGITPMYRGVHGGYWALVNKDYENCGVTVHEVDAGIDTGKILYQENIKITKQDNFVTYPYLQTAQAVPLLQNAISDALTDQLKPVVRTGNSDLWYHPTIWQYFYNRLIKKVK